MNEKLYKKLKKIKSLAERGIGQEKVSAEKLYEELKNKYGVNDIDIDNLEVNIEWFRFKDFLEKRLVMQICYMVTGSKEFYSMKDNRYKMVGHSCTEFEKSEIEFYFKYYKDDLKKELDMFMTSYSNVNKLFPSNTARCYKEEKSDDDTNIDEIIRLQFMMKGIEECKKPLKQIK